MLVMQDYTQHMKTMLNLFKSVLVFGFSMYLCMSIIYWDFISYIYQNKNTWNGKKISYSQRFFLMCAVFLTSHKLCQLVLQLGKWWCWFYSFGQWDSYIFWVEIILLHSVLSQREKERWREGGVCLFLCLKQGFFV